MTIDGEEVRFMRGRQAAQESRRTSRRVNHAVSMMMVPKHRQIREFNSASDNGDANGQPQDRPDFENQFDCCDWRCDPNKPGNFPYFTILISLLQIGIFVYYYTLNTDAAGVLAYQFDSFNENTLCSPFILSPWHRHEVWRYMLYQFNHAGWTHLFSNLLFQLTLGSLIESVHGTRDVIFIYCGGVVLGACTGLVLSPDKMTVGASGGDYALVFAYLANLIVNWDSMVGKTVWKWARLAFLVWFISMDIYNFVANKLNSVSIGGHLGGAIVGLTLGLYILENFYESHPVEKYISYGGLFMFIVFVIFSVCWQIFSPTLKENDSTLPPCRYFGHCLANANATSCS